MEYVNLKYSVVDHVAIIKLNRPDKLNALTNSIWDEINCVMDEIMADDDAISVLLCGEGRSFCAGFL